MPLLWIGAASLLAAAWSERTGATGPSATFGSAGTSLNKLSMTLRSLVQYVKPNVMKRLDTLEGEIDDTVRSTLSEAPVRAIDLIAETATQGIDRLAALVPDDARRLLGLKSEIARTAMTANQATNLAEVSEAFDALTMIIAKDKTLAQLVDNAAQRLEVDNLLGEGPLRSVLTILGTVAAGGAVVGQWSGGKLIAVDTPYGRIGLSKNLDYLASVRLAPQRLAGAALQLSVEGQGMTKAPTVATTLTTPFLRHGTTTLGVKGGPTGVTGMSAGVGFQTIPERGRIDLGVSGTPKTPLQRVSISAPTELSKSRLGRPTTLSPMVTIDPRTGGERRVGAELKIPL